LPEAAGLGIDHDRLSRHASRGSANGGSMASTLCIMNPMIANATEALA
jgi:hypothetical protein